MPKTEAEWRAIDNTLARSLMGFTQQDDGGVLLWLNSNLRSSDYLVSRPATHLYGIYEGDAVWEPHINREQAMRVLDAIQARGCGIDIFMFPAGHSMVVIWLVSNGAPYLPLREKHDIMSKAACLAAYTWLDV